MFSDGVSVRRGRPRTDALRQKRFRLLGDGGSDPRGRPRTAALRQKRFRVLEDGASDGWGAEDGRAPMPTPRKLKSEKISHSFDQIILSRPSVDFNGVQSQKRGFSVESVCKHSIAFQQIA